MSDKRSTEYLFLSAYLRAKEKNLLGRERLARLAAAPNAAEAACWYRVGAEAGDRNAMERLGECFAKGVGVAENKAEALRWLLASQGTTVEEYVAAIRAQAEGK